MQREVSSTGPLMNMMPSFKVYAQKTEVNPPNLETIAFINFFFRNNLFWKTGLNGKKINPWAYTGVVQHFLFNTSFEVCKGFHKDAECLDTFSVKNSRNVLTICSRVSAFFKEMKRGQFKVRLT